MANATDTTHTLLRAEGFSCLSCVTKIEKQVGKLDGVENVTVHFASGLLRSTTMRQEVPSTISLLLSIRPAISRRLPRSSQTAPHALSSPIRKAAHL